MTGKKILIYKEVLLIICLFILFSNVCACSKEEPQEPENTVQTESLQPLSLAMYTGEKLDPYTAKSMANKNISSLCYCGLFAVNDQWTEVPILASEYNMTENKLSVTIKSDAVFSDGTSVTAQDCVYSFNKAKAEGSIYASRFIYIKSYVAQSHNVFVITFTDASLNNVNLLDIPIIKSGSDKNEYPIGAGAYFPKSSPNGDGTDGLSLYPNKHFMLEDVSVSQKIKVNKYNSSEEMLYAFNYGSVHAMYANISEGKNNYRGNIELSVFTTNNFVFAYINPKSVYFTNRAVASQGLSYAINRKALVSETLNGCATDVWFPYNPTWGKVVAAQLNNDIYSLELAKNRLYEARLYVNNGKLEWYGKPAEIKIVVNNDSFSKSSVAKKIAEDLNAVGFTATVESLKWEEYEKAVKEGNYDIFIGEIKMPANMDILSFESIIGFKYSNVMAEAIRSFNEGRIGVREFMTVFSSEMPFIPLYFTQSALAVNRVVKGTFTPSENYLFFNIETWKVSS
ncbi:MAG: hypothetical protein DBX47_05085 [Clostridiales bacterium]|nr:MAG: hypothetical protein DBX47_05085 [Clostridiales bacterium]